MLANSYFEVLWKIASNSVEEKIPVPDPKVVCQEALYFSIHIFRFCVGLSFSEIIQDVVLVFFYHFSYRFKSRYFGFVYLVAPVVQFIFKGIDIFANVLSIIPQP